MKREFWFVVGSQFLYGPEVLVTVEKRAREMAAELSKVLPYPLIYKVTAKTNKEITDVVKEANFRDGHCHLVPHLLPLQDVDRRPSGPEQALVPLRHPVQ